jgi:predicted ATPase
MINKLHIQNFKIHKDTEIQLNKLTILTGINGCGKTSLIQTLLLLRQTFQKGRLMDGLDLNKPLCNIGIGNDALCRYATEGRISFCLMESNGESYAFSFDANVKAMSDNFLKKDTYEGPVTNDKLAQLSLFNNEFQYVSAARWGGISVFPKETYAVESQKQISLECGQGELVAQYLHKFGADEVLDYSNGELTDLSLYSQTIFWEQKISPNISIHVESGKDNNSFAITYGYTGSGEIRPIKDLKAENVGYGISYTLPVVVALLSAKPGALLIIENPEAHLHPAGQSELAKLITKVANNGVQVIVETHSDHIISGIQLACKAHAADSAKGIHHQDVAMYYFRPSADRSLTIEQIKVLETGRLDFQPKGFFDQAETDMFNLYK